MGGEIASAEPAAAVAVGSTPAPRRRDWRGALGMGTALVLAFVWGGIADRQMGPGKAAARVLPVAAQGTAVAGAQAAPQGIDDFASAFCQGHAHKLAPRIR